MQICSIRGRSTQLGGLKNWRTIKDKRKGKIKKKGIGARCGTADENITQEGRQESRKKEKLKLNMRKGVDNERKYNTRIREERLDIGMLKQGKWQEKEGDEKIGGQGIY